jgi:hypothetical protein
MVLLSVGAREDGPMANSGRRSNWLGRGCCEVMAKKTESAVRAGDAMVGYGGLMPTGDAEHEHSWHNHTRQLEG